MSGPDSANRSVREQFAPADEPWDRLGQVNTASVCARGTPNKLRRLIKANGWVRLSAASRTSSPGTLTGSADEWTSVESRYDPIDLSTTQVTGVVAVGSSRIKSVGSFRSARAMAARGDGVEVGLSQGPARDKLKG